MLLAPSPGVSLLLAYFIIKNGNHCGCRFVIYLNLSIQYVV